MSANNEGLTRFIESMSFDNKFLKKAEIVELRESLSRCPKRLTESVNTEAAEGWWVPISFYNHVNGNGRDYNRQLWENVESRQKDTWCGSPMLCDHPAGDSDGNPKDICGVWIDMKLGDPDNRGCGLVYGLLVPSGRIGQDLKDHLANGLKIGTSSSGFGKLMNDGVTVDPNTYQIERLADWVLNPSQGTFFSWDESNDIQDKSIRESQENNTTTETIKEKVVKDSKITKLEEKKFRRDMESFLESADNIKDPQERLEEFKEIKSYLEEGACPDLKEKVEQKIAEQEAFIRSALQEKIELKEELDIDGPKDLKQKLTKICEDVNLYKEEAHDWKKISEKLQSKCLKMQEDLKARPTEAYVDYLKEKNEKLNEEFNEKMETSKSLLIELKEAYGSVLNEKDALQCKIDDLEHEIQCKDCQIEDYDLLEKKCAELEDEIACKNCEPVKEDKSAVLKEKLRRAHSQISVLANSLNNTGNKFREASSRSSELLVAFNEFKENSSRDFAVQKNEAECAELALKEANARIAELCEILEAKEREIEALKESNDNKKSLLSELVCELKKKAVEKKAIEKKACIEEKKEPNEVEAYYDELYKLYGNDVAPFENEIKASITLAEAKKYFFRNVLQNLRDTRNIDALKLPENLYTSPEERIGAMNEKKFKKVSAIDRKPEGWL